MHGVVISKKGEGYETKPYIYHITFVHFINAKLGPFDIFDVSVFLKQNIAGSFDKLQCYSKKVKFRFSEKATKS